MTHWNQLGSAFGSHHARDSRYFQGITLGIRGQRGKHRSADGYETAGFGFAPGG